VAFRRHHLLALIPAVALVGAPWFANRLEPRPFGMPFLLAWIVGWILVTSACMWVIGRLDERAE
jgi:hypothetical protein